MQRGIHPEEQGVPQRNADRNSAIYKEILTLAAAAADTVFWVDEAKLDPNVGIGLSIKYLEPPSNWKDWEQYDEYDHK